MIASDAQRPAVAAAVRDIVGPAAARLGGRRFRARTSCRVSYAHPCSTRLALSAKMPAVQTRARELYDAWQQDPAKANRDLQPAFVSILAHSGDAKRYQEFKKHFKSARTPQEEQSYLFSLANFRDLALLRQTMEMTLNGDVRTQNSPYLLHSLLANNVSRIEAWEYIKRNWETIVGKFPDSALPRMCEAINGLARSPKRSRGRFFTSTRCALAVN